MNKRTDLNYMQQALTCAKQAAIHKEVPVGAVLVAEGECIFRAYNQTITRCDPTAHAEILVLREAANTLKNYRLLNATLYVTLEPCLMCVGAMIQARIKRLVFAAYDERLNSLNVANLLKTKEINHRFIVTDGLMQQQASDLLKAFFLKRRK